MNFKVMQIVMQRKFPFCARRERSSARRARGAGSLGRGGGGVEPGASSGAGPEEGSCRGLQDAFGAVRLAGCRKRARSEPGSFNARPTLPRNGSPRRTSEPARERCYLGPSHVCSQILGSPLMYLRHMCEENTQSQGKSQKCFRGERYLVPTMLHNQAENIIVYGALGNTLRSVLL